MLDLAARTDEARNYGLRKASDPRALSESLRFILPLAVIAVAFSFQIWIHSQGIQIGYQVQQFKAQEEESLRIRQQLILEEEILKDLASLEALARRDLGMVPLRVGQIIPAPIENWETSSSVTIALGSLFQSSDSKKQPAFN